MWDVCRTRILVHSALGAVLLGVGGCGPDPNGPGSYQSVVKGQESAEESLKKSGAKLDRKQYPLGKGWVIDLAGAQLSDSVFGALKKLDNVAELNLSGSSITDADMDHFDSKLSGMLVKLDLSNTEVGDEGLEQLKDCRFLMNLNLSKTKVTDGGVAQWRKSHTVDDRIAKIGVKIER